MYSTDYYDASAISGAAAGGVFGALIGFFATFFIIILAVAVLQIIGYWKILKKGNQPGWGSLIPIYNQYLLCKMVGVNPWWILIALCSSVLNFIPIIGSLAAAVVSIYFLILLNVSLARSFGKDSSYAVGLILLPPVFYLMLGCGSSSYIGANPMNDIIFNKKNNNSNDNNINPNNPTNMNAGVNNSVNDNSNLVNQTSNNFNNPTDNNVVANNNSSSQSVKYCTECGNQMDLNSKFCPNCGKENI